MKSIAALLALGTASAKLNLDFSRFLSEHDTGRQLYSHADWNGYDLEAAWITSSWLLFDSNFDGKLTENQCVLAMCSYCGTCLESSVKDSVECLCNEAAELTNDAICLPDYKEMLKKKWNLVGKFRPVLEEITSYATCDTVFGAANHLSRTVGKIQNDISDCGAGTQEFKDQMLSHINDIRGCNCANPTVWSDELAAIAQEHAEKMAQCLACNEYNADTEQYASVQFSANSEVTAQFTDEQMRRLVVINWEQGSQGSFEYSGEYPAAQEDDYSSDVINWQPSDEVGCGAAQAHNVHGYSNPDDDEDETYYVCFFREAGGHYDDRDDHVGDKTCSVEEDWEAQYF